MTLGYLVHTYSAYYEEDLLLPNSPSAESAGLSQKVMIKDSYFCLAAHRINYQSHPCMPSLTLLVCKFGPHANFSRIFPIFRLEFFWSTVNQFSKKST